MKNLDFQMFSKIIQPTHYFVLVTLTVKLYEVRAYPLFILKRNSAIPGHHLTSVQAAELVKLN